MESVLKDFFDPSTVGVVGASRELGKIGNTLLKNIIAAGYKGKIFPVNPTAQEILGLKAYPSIIDVPAPLDLVIIAVPSKFVLTIIEQCARKGVKAAIIISGGFGEIGEDGKERERVLLEIAKKANIRIIGPNCQGINNPHVGLCATWPLVKTKGPIAIISQSGTVGAAFQGWADKETIGISAGVNLGNKIDVNEVDLLQYLGHDRNTKAIALYIEGIANGRNLMKVASDVSKYKPIIVLKGGRTKAGQKAASSHTRSLAGKDEIFDAAFKQIGVARANTSEELYDLSKAFSFLSLPKGRGVFIMTSSGGSGVLAVDMCKKLELMLPEPSEQAIKRLRKILPDICTFSNPFDLTLTTADKFSLVLRENMDNEKIHAFISIFGDPIPNAAEEIEKASMATSKPIIVSYLGGGEIESTEIAKMYSMGIPVFPTPERAVIALYALVKYSEYLRKTHVNIF